MKRILLFALLTISVVFTTSEVSVASHGMGGEITWTCLGSGQYKFRMKFYRDCNGITPGNTLQMQTTVPGTPTIQLNLVQQNDISPNGLNANGVTPCYNCVDGSFGSPIPGLVEEYIYESAAVTLNGVPPATGWIFRWGECCRSSALTNITGGGSLGFQNRAIMYPYNGQNTNPCFDSSPYFTEKPSTIICTGYPFKYNPNAVDPELDSLVYSWGQPLDDGGNVIPFAPGYNVNSQLPSTTQNPNNVAASINPQTGEITYTSFTGGYFATVVKVTAYKCNIKVAEIFREINVVLNSSCPPVQTGINNSPPDVNAPFYHPVTGAQTEYIDTVYAGDTVNFFLNATDFEFFTNGGVQTITIEASGNEFGTNYTNPNAGCIIPPCATLSQAAPFSFQIGGGVGFNWVTTCDHVKGLDLACARISNRYNFIIKATDNYCPANASNVSTISIVILAAPKLKPPVLRCASVNTDGSVALSWTKSTPRDSQNTFFAYDVYASQNAAGPFLLVDSIKTGFNANTYTHTAASLNAMFGTNAQQASIYYYLRTRSGCDGDSVSVPSDTLRTIKLNVALNGSNEAVLTWNALRVPLLSSHDTKYKIYKNFPIGTWTLIDSTAALTFTDTTTKVLCNDSVVYRVQLPDSSGCISVSSLDGIMVTNPNPIATILPANPAFCTGGNVVLTANVGLSYSWNTGATTQSITVTNAGTYTVTVTQAGNCTATGSTTVTVNPLPNPVISGNTSVCQGSCTTFNAGPGFSTYAWSTGATTQTISVCTSGPYTVTVTTAFGCSKSTSQSLTVNPNPVPNITGVSTICQGQSTNLNAGAGYQSYLWAPGGATTQQLPVTTGGTYTVTVTALNGCTGTDNQVVVVNPLPTPVITGVTSICQGQSTILDAGPGYSSYLWAPGGQVTQTKTVSTSGTYTVTVTNANGCSNSATKTVTVNPLPVPAITGNNVICQGQNTIFNAGSYSSYLWAPGGQTTQNISVNTAGTYTVTVTDANNCSATTSRTLTVNANPVPVITGNFVICQGQNTNLNAGGGYTSYLWNNGATTQILNVTAPGPWAVTVTNANNCSATTSQAVTVNALPNPVITGDLSICQGLSTTLNAGAGFATYQWSTGATTQTINVSTATTVTVTVSNANGCVKSTSAATVVNPNPSPTITGTMSVCQGSTTVITPGPGYSAYLWSTGATTQSINIGTAGPVTVTVTDVNGCIGSDNTNITVFALPSATISGIDTICFGQATSFNISFSGPGPYVYTYFDGTTNQGPFTTATGSVNIPVSPTANTTYTLVNVSNANTLCNGTISGQAKVVVTPLPTAQLTGTTDICSGSSTNLSINFTGVGPYTYSYLAGATVYGPFTTNNDPESIQVTPSNTTVYSLTPTVIGAGCTGNTNPATATVTVNVLPSASIAGNNTICAGETTNLTINFNGTGPFTYTYSNGTNNYGPFNTPNDPHTVTVTPGVNTTYTLVSISDANCPGSVAGSANITVNPLPTATITGTNSICEGGDIDISILFTGTGPYTYSYNDGTNVFGPFTTNQNPAIVNVSPSATTTYGVTSVSDANCTGTVAGAATVTVIPLPTATLSGSTDICIGSSTNLQLSMTGVPPFEYKYTDGTTIFGPFTINNPNVLINVAPTSNTTYSLTTITGAGCAGTYSGSASIVVNPLPEATMILTGDDIICAGEGSQFNISFTGTGPFNYSYTDGSSNFGPFTTSNNPEIIPVTPGSSTTYTPVSITDQNCTGTVTGSAQITVNPLPTVVASANLAICDGSSTSFSINFTGTGPFTYTYSDGSGTIGPVTTSSNPEIINVNPSVTTTYNVLTVTDANCTGTTSGTVNVTVNNIPTATISGDAEICVGASTDLTINFTGVAPFTYFYTNGTTNFGPLVATTNSAVIPVSPGINTTYSLVSLNDANCPGTLNGNVQIIVNPLPQPVITGDFEICDGETSTFSTSPGGFTSYTWSNGLMTPSITTSDAGVYTVTVIDGNGCAGTSPAINFIVNQTPVISFTNDTSLTCEIPSINFQNNSSYPPGSEFTWDFGDNSGISNQVNPSHLYNTPGVYDITLTITTQAGCTATLTQSTEIMFFPLPVADFTANPMVTNIFNAKVAFTDESDYAVTWTWEFGDSDKSNQQNPIHYFNDIGEYRVKLTVTNIAGCVDEKIQEIVVNPFYIPNAFTPNDDGTNDAFFEAGYVLDVQSYHMSIFNRWGQVVYEADNYNKFWSGYDKDGNKAPEGVYVYSIDVVTKGGKKHNFNGTVTLIR